MLSAFGLGILAASSLLLGAIVARLRRLPSFVLGALMAFGGGVLLAALTLEIAGPALSRGHVWPFVIGCFFGGLLYIFLEQHINARGGFLRKTATTISFVRRQEQRRLRDLLRSLGRLDVFEGQPDHVLSDLSEGLVALSYDAGSTIYRLGDPCNNLYVVAEGEVELIQAEPTSSRTSVPQRSAFGYLAFLAGMRHTVTAVARTPVRLWRLPREDFLQAVRNSVVLSRSYERYLGSSAAEAYLEDVWGMDRAAREKWNTELVQALHERGELPSLADETTEGEGDVATLLHHFPDLESLPDDEVQLLAEHVFIKTHQPGHTFFHRGEAADRIYFLDAGHVALVDGSPGARETQELKPGRIFGTLSFLTGGHHTATAVAASEVRVGVLRRRDLETVLGRCPHLKDAIEAWLQNTEMEHYLETRQGLERGRASAWVRGALRSLRAGRLLPSVESMVVDEHRTEGAPIAIWLGILLDSIPEAVVIGASLVYATPSALAALIVGLFVANFPEALSSTAGMLEQGLPFRKLLRGWLGIVLITGCVAALASAALVAAPWWVSALFLGLAVGGLLTMIAETMLPEAYARGGQLTGLATLLGFLTAILISAFTHGRAAP